MESDFVAHLQVLNDEYGLRTEFYKLQQEIEELMGEDVVVETSDLRDARAFSDFVDAFVRQGRIRTFEGTIANLRAAKEAAAEDHVMSLPVSPDAAVGAQ